MATKYGDDIVELKGDMKRAQDDIKEIKNDVKEGFKAISDKIDNLPEVFITRREGNVLRVVIVILLAAVSAIAGILLVTKR